MLGVLTVVQVCAGTFDHFCHLKKCMKLVLKSKTLNEINIQLDNLNQENVLMSSY